MVPNYFFGKGPIAVLLETYLGVRENAMRSLREIESGAAPEEMDFVRRVMSLKNIGDIASHVVDDTLGPGSANEIAGLRGNDLRAAIAAGDRRRTVFLAGTKRAIEVAYGVKEDGDPSRDWPIEIFWGCGRLEPECWVSWRPERNGRNGGRVTLVVFNDVQETPHRMGARATKLERDASLGIEVVRFYKGKAVRQEPPFDLGYPELNTTARRKTPPEFDDWVREMERPRPDVEAAGGGVA